MAGEPAILTSYADYLTFERAAPTKHEYVLVAQKAQRIEVYRREGERWVLTEHGPGTTVELPSIDARIPVDEVYRDPLAP